MEFLDSSGFGMYHKEIQEVYKSMWCTFPCRDVPFRFLASSSSIA